MTDRRSLSVTDLAKEIRAELRRRFPATKFSVRSDSYSMGSSVRISWVDGPSQRYVDEVVGAFEGRSFDGMTDSTSYHPITLPSGEVVSAHSYVSTTRKLSSGFVNRIIAALAWRLGTPAAEIPTASDFGRGDLWSCSPFSVDVALRDSWQSLIHAAAEDRTAATA